MRLTPLLLLASTASALNLTASTLFTLPPGESAAHKLVNNGEYTTMNLRLVNGENGPVKVAEVHGALVDPETGAAVKRFKPLPIGKVVGKGKTFIQPYSVQASSVPAQRLRLEVELVLASPEKLRVTAFNGTVDVVEKEGPVLDAQL